LIGCKNLLFAIREGLAGKPVEKFFHYRGDIVQSIKSRAWNEHFRFRTVNGLGSEACV